MGHGVGIEGGTKDSGVGGSPGGEEKGDQDS